MLKQKGERSGAWTPIPDGIRRRAHRRRCEVCGIRYGARLGQFDAYGYRLAVEHLHHIFPRRWLALHNGNAHKLAGLLSSCQFCHGRFKEVDEALFCGDALRFMAELKRLGVPFERVERAARAHGVWEILRLLT